jgi:Cell Wall Hydrolase
MPNVADFEKSLLALVMWRSLDSDGLQGMVAVGLVVRNRVLAGWNGGNWLAVIAATSEYSMTWPDTRDPMFQAVLARADSIYDGREPDITNGALYYANLSAGGLSPWFLTNILRKPEVHARLGTVGQRTFFA